jgi:succinate-acetate transporter protein
VINGHNTGVTDHAQAKKRAPYDYGGNPLAHIATNNSDYRMQAFGGEFQPGLYRAPKSNFGNPAPLGLSAFALTTFVLSLINLRTRGVNEPNLVVACAFGYGGLVQLLAGMWEMAVGNTFGATALSSYGGFWISFAIVLTPGGFNIVSALGGAESALFLDSFGFFLMVMIVNYLPPDLADIWLLGLVHLYLPPPDLHSQIHRRLFLLVLNPGPRIPLPRHWVSRSRKWCSTYYRHQSRWCIWHPSCILGVV